MNNELLEEFNGLIKKVAGPDPFWQEAIKRYFDKLDKTDEEKFIFLKKISIDEKEVNAFSKDINSGANPNDIFDKYNKKNTDFENHNEAAVNQSVDELIKKVAGPDPFWQDTIKRYFDKLDKTDEEKAKFLQKVSIDRKIFNDFTKDINSGANPNDIFDKYTKLLMK